MLDFYLHAYKQDNGTNAFNAPHKYRFALKKGLNKDLCLRAWNIGKYEVMRQLNEKINTFINDDECFGFIIPPSKTHIFIDDIRKYILETFPLAVDLSDCFSKTKSFDAGASEDQLSDQELKDIFKLDGSLYESKNKEGLNTIFILDDVYAKGNTIKGIYLALTEHENTKTIRTGVILNTNE